MSSGRVLNFSFAIVLLAVSALGATYLYRNYQELEFMRQKEQLAAARLAELKAESSTRAQTLDKLQNDARHIERSIRSKLNYGKADETIFRFE